MKQYPERIKTQTYPICECSHSDFDHDLGILHPGKCEKCMCPKFIKEKELTMQEYANEFLRSLGLNIPDKPKEKSVSHD